MHTETKIRSETPPQKRSFHTNCSYKTRLLHFDLNFIWQPRRVINRRFRLIATEKGMLIECDHRSRWSTCPSIIPPRCCCSNGITQIWRFFFFFFVSELPNGRLHFSTLLSSRLYTHLTVIHRNQSQPTETRVSDRGTSHGWPAYKGVNSSTK